MKKKPLLWMTLAALLPFTAGRQSAAYAMQTEAEPADQLVLTEKDLSSEKKQNTVMIYMVGSNLESRYGNATMDLCEIQWAEIDPTISNVLVYTGGSRRWHSDIPNDRNSVIDMAKDEGQWIVAQTEGRVDMGQKETLTDFVDFCYENYPAEHYSLIFWDHGGGPLLGYGSDELFGGSSLTLSEMDQAMKESSFAIEERLDFVGFDACLMGSLETMNVWSKYADYYVASEETEPGFGWDYTAFSVLNLTSDPREITQSIVDCYEAYGGYYQDSPYKPDMTLSVTDLSKVKKVKDALGTLSSTMKRNTAGASYTKLQRIRSDSKAFGLTNGADTDDDDCYDLVDLKDFAERIEEEYPAKAAKLLSALEEFVVTSYSNVEGAGGVSFYYPYRNKLLYNAYGAFYQEFSFQSQYQSFLKTLTTKWLNAKAKDWTIEAAEKVGNEYQIQLTQEQASNTVAAYYSVLGVGEAYHYWPILRRVRITPDENGVLHIPADPKVISMKADDGEVYSWPAVQMENTEDSAVYFTEQTKLFTDSDDLWQMPLTVYDEEWNTCQISLAQDKKKSTLQIKNITAQEGGIANSGKNTINTTHYETLYYIRKMYHPTRNENGTMLSFSEWVESGDTYIEYNCLGEDFSFVMEKTSKLEQKAVIQVELRDASGAYYGSELFPVSGSGEVKKLEVSTEEGVMNFHIFNNAAVLDKYEGKDETLEIPEKVSGYRVETIGSHAFVSADVTEIIIPKTVKRIGKNAFALCSKLEKIDLPVGLGFIGEAAFKSCKSLTEIRLGGRLNGICKAAVLRDGVLFSRDEKTLLAYPASRTVDGELVTEYTVPEGVEEIGYGAFTSAKLEKIVLPESLLRIGTAAFTNCVKLEMPVLPAKLETLEAHAFGADDGSLFFGDESKKQEVIRIGPAVSYIGEGAFDLFASRRFEVDEENTSFAAVNGWLCNKAGDTIVAFALDGTLHMEIPDTIRILEADQFKFELAIKLDYDNWNQAVDIEIPAGVQMISGEWRRLLGKTILHVEEDSEAHRYALANELEFNFCFDESDEAYRTAVIVTKEDTTTEKDGFLFDEDGRILLEAPSDIVNAVIPEGTEEIAEKAFYHCEKMETIEIPEGVRIIGDNAFGYCRSLREVALPMSLEEIGYNVFAGNENLSISGGVLKLGKEFRTMSYTSFNNIQFEAFEVEAGNIKYGATEGFLTDPSGSVLYKAPTTVPEVVEIPETILVIKNGAFDFGYFKEGMYPVKEVILPKGLSFIGKHAFSYGAKPARTYRINES